MGAWGWGGPKLPVATAMPALAAAAFAAPYCCRGAGCCCWDKAECACAERVAYDDAADVLRRAGLLMATLVYQ